MIIRKATQNDVDSIMSIYDFAKQFMIEAGNPTQWNGSYPERELIQSDIEKGQFYVGETDHVCAGFCFIVGKDPTYAYIENGQWLNNELYGTIHRIATDGTVHGFFSDCVDYCSKICSNIRMDTHNDNKPMQRAALSKGFTKCGIIYVEDGSPRIAFQKEI